MGWEGLPYQYQGQVDENDKRCGFGRWTQNNNWIYEGQFKNDMPNGFGRFIYNNGCYYIGEYKDNHRFGSGVFVDA